MDYKEETLKMVKTCNEIVRKSIHKRKRLDVGHSHRNREERSESLPKARTQDKWQLLLVYFSIFYHSTLIRVRNELICETLAQWNG